MRIGKQFLLIVLFIALLGGLFAILIKPTNLLSKKDKVAVTIYPTFDIVRNVAGDEIDVVLILPPGASPHTFDPSPQEIKSLLGSKAVFAIGFGLDGWVSKLSESAGVKNVITLEKNIDLLGFEEDPTDISINPHYWLSVKNAEQIAVQVRDELVIMFPEKEISINENYKKYRSELKILDGEIESRLSELEESDIATFHNAWGYFARDYDVNVVATFEEFPGEEPTAEFLKEFQEKVRSENVNVIFAEPQFSTRPIEPIVNDLGIEISVLDPLGGVEGRETYIQMMRYNLNQIVEALK